MTGVYRPFGANSALSLEGAPGSLVVMNKSVFNSRQYRPKKSFGALSRVRRTCNYFIPGWIQQHLHRIGNRLALLVVGLIALLTLGTAFLVIGIMDDVLLRSMVKRGAASVYAIAGSAGYSILADDRLALDNLTAQEQRAQDDLVYVAIIDHSRKILAHSQLDLADSILPQLTGELIENDGPLRVSQVVRYGHRVYEFSLPINFAGHLVGEVVTGLDPLSLISARSAARWRILFIASLAIFSGIIGTLVLARRFTYPLTQLSQGVERLKAGTGKVRVPVLANDELGELTQNFNKMAAEIATQRQSLIEYSTNLEKSYHDIVRILAGALDARDNYTYGHSARVASLAVMLGKQLGQNEQQLKDLEMSCLLHDIGKIRVPDCILNKQAPLDEKENSRIREHPRHGAEILTLADSLHRYIPTVKHHHEWYNGQGYPASLQGEQIPLTAQIVAIADAYDAMTTSRPYRQGLPPDAAISEIQRYRGTQFSPWLTDLFIKALQGEQNIPQEESGF